MGYSVLGALVSGGKILAEIYFSYAWGMVFGV
jgi:hypothetical protein